MQPTPLPNSSLCPSLAMIEEEEEQQQQDPQALKERQKQYATTTTTRRWRRWCLISLAAILLFFLSLSIVILVLSLTIFKPRIPQIQVLSSTLDGISPRFTFPLFKLELNISIDLTLLVRNQNRVTFRHGQGETVLFYRGVQVGEAELNPGEIPAMRSLELQSGVTFQIDRLASDMGALVGDVLTGEIAMASRTTVPGRVELLKVFKKHVVVTMKCRFRLGIIDMTIRSQECKQKAKL